MPIAYLISEKHTHKLLFPHSLCPVSYIIIVQCFILRLASTRGTPLNGEFFLHQ